jgi:hypothetical protein
MSHGNEIADLIGGYSKDPPAYKARSFTNKLGKHVVRMEFENVIELERFFIDELLGSPMMEGSASKAIGRILLIWDR